MKKTCMIIMVLVLLCMSCVYAISVGSPIGTTDPDTSVLGDAVPKIIGAIRWVGYIIAVAILIYIGIKYIMASAQEKADLKGQLIKYVIGAVLIIFGTQIAAWAFSIGGSSGGGGSANVEKGTQSQAQTGFSGATQEVK